MAFQLALLSPYIELLASKKEGNCPPFHLRDSFRF